MKIYDLYYWSKPLPGLRAGSFDKNPKMNNPTKKVTTVYTNTLRDNIFI